jgi:predicted O-linked N-acetylglucosamine transferase (SPINDLY family)
LRGDVAADLCRRAAEAIRREDWGEAESLYGRVVAMGVAHAGVYNNLAALCDRQGKREESFALLRKAVGLGPDDAGIKKNLLSALARKAAPLLAQRRLRAAIPLLQEMVVIDPQSAPSQRDLGHCYAQLGELKAALECFARAISLAPQEATYYNEFGLACYELRLLGEAKGAFQQVLRLEPKKVAAYVHLGLLANLTGLSAVAVNMLRRAIEIDPQCGEAHNNLALFLRDQGLQQECRRHYLRAMELKPSSTDILSSYLLSLNDDPLADPAWVAAEHRRFQALAGGELRCVVTEAAAEAPRLRVGYLSPDFRQHSVAYFILPVLRAHDRAAVEVTCYSTSPVEDGVTREISAACEHWRKVYRMPDEALADQIVQDKIDVLVELSGHTKDNRLPMLARRVAPVQVTYLGYPNTTGLAEMDCRITDAIADPPGECDAWHTERLVRIDGGFLAYSPAYWARDLPVVALPAREAGCVTFGSFNNLAKINDKILDIWASILAAVPQSVLLLKARGLRDDRIQERILSRFAAQGLDAKSRVEMLGHERSGLDHMRLYHRVDLALDTFPYNGTTTTLEALWMGTPVVTLLGKVHAGRVGASILSRVGLGELVCGSRESYVDTAIGLAMDLPRLARVRDGLRSRLLDSPLMDAQRLARHLEAAYAQALRARRGHLGERDGAGIAQVVPVLPTAPADDQQGCPAP